MTAKHIEQRPALNRAGVYVVIDKTAGTMAGKMLIAHPQDGAGRLYVSLWDFTGTGHDVQNGSVTGFGYDKLASAIDGMRFGTGNQEFTLDCDSGMSTAEEQFRAHGYILQWLV
jgi:hypothetical protein